MKLVRVELNKTPESQKEERHTSMGVEEQSRSNDDHNNEAMEPEGDNWLPISLRHIYLIETVAEVVKEGIHFTRDSGYVFVYKCEKDRVFGVSLFQEAAKKCAECKISLVLGEGDTARYFKETCEVIFKLNG